MSGPLPDPPDPFLASLFDAERSRPAPPDAARARVLARVSATVAAGSGSSGSARCASGSALPASGAALGGPILLGLALGGALVAAVAVFQPSHEGGADGDTRRASPRSTAMEPAALPVSTSVAEPPAVRPLEAARPRSSAEPTPAVRHEESLAAEQAILDEANEALASGRSAAAFAALARHAEQFPRGRLSEEREGLWLRTLLAEGRKDEARARAARFKQLYPHSMLLPALEATLGAIP
jgi:hypothetical protein